jgi:hypothetical protein
LKYSTLQAENFKPLPIQNFSAGDHEVMFHSLQLSAGIYLLQVKIDDQLEVRKLMVE